MSVAWGKDGPKFENMRPIAIDPATFGSGIGLRKWMTREELSDIYPDSEPAPAHIGRYDAVLYVGLSILGLCTLVALAWVALAWTL